MGRKPNTNGMKVDPDDIEFESMIFYITWYNTLKKCGDDFFLKAIKELCEYSFHGVVPDNSDDILMDTFFNMAKGSIDANIKLRIAGRRGVEARKNKTSDTEEKPETKKRGRKKKEDVIPEPEPEEEEDPFMEMTDENIAKIKAEIEQDKERERLANGEG